MYIRRWLQATMEGRNGKLEEPQGEGTPQGGVIIIIGYDLYNKSRMIESFTYFSVKGLG